MNSGLIYFRSNRRTEIYLRAVIAHTPIMYWLETDQVRLLSVTTCAYADLPSDPARLYHQEENMAGGHVSTPPVRLPHPWGASGCTHQAQLHTSLAV